MWTFNPLIPTEVHYVEKSPEMFSSNNLFFFDWRKKNMNILDDMGVSKFSFRSEVNL